MKKLALVLWLFGILTSVVMADPGKRLTSKKDLLADKDILKKTPVLIYYANDLNLKPGKDAIRDEWAGVVDGLRASSKSTLTAAQKAYLADFADAVEGDLDTFELAVDVEIKTLREAVCRKNPIWKIGLVTVRNAKSVSLLPKNASGINNLQIRWERCEDSQPITEYLNLDWDIPDTAEGRLHAQPLSDRGIFKKLMNAIIGAFPSDQYRYVFFGKSRGTKSLLFEETYFKGASKIPAQKLWDALSARDGETATMKVGEGFRQKTAMVVDTLWSLANPALVPKKTESIDKESFLEMVWELGGADPKVGAFFSQVALDSAFGNFELSADPDFVKLLGTPYYEGLDAENVGYVHPREVVSSYLYVDLEKLVAPLVKSSDDFAEHAQHLFEKAGTGK